MDKRVIIYCKSLTKTYTLTHGSKQNLLAAFGIGRKRYTHDALKEIDLTIRLGEVVGILGLNGSGKSTLARIITGITTKTSGVLAVNGKVNMLAASSGLFDHLTGMENIRYKCALMGMSVKQIDDAIPEIIAFADLGKYINFPLRTYSSGMKARLGFAIAISNLPDILIVDEAISVGDTGFAERCKRKMQEIRDSGRTVIFVSHAVGQMEEFCDRVIWMHNGQILADDIPKRLILPYCAFARDHAGMTITQQQHTMPDLAYYQKIAFPHGMP